MDDFEDRARRAGDALNDAVIDLEPANVAPRPSRSRRGAGVALVVLVGLIAAGVAVSQSDDHRDSLRADVTPSTTQPESASAASPRYLPRWLPNDISPSQGTVGAGCSSSTGQAGPLTTVSLPPGIHSASLTGTIRLQSAIAGASDSNGCPSAWWTAILTGPASAGSRIVFLSGGFPSTSPSDAQAVTVRGRAASLFSLSTSSSVPSSNLSWSEGDITLSITGIGLTRDELLKIAESVERVSDDEWNDVFKPGQSPSMPQPIARPDLTDATELARLSTADGQFARLLVTADGSLVCISNGTSFGCIGGGGSVPSSPRLVTLSGTYGLILLPAGLPADFVLRRASGETLPSARSGDGRYLLFAGASFGTDYEIIDTAGRVLATSRMFTCPQSASSTLCTAPATTR